MGNWEQWLSIWMLSDLKQRYNQGHVINKYEIDTATAISKRSHAIDVENNSMLNTEQKEKQKRLFSKAIDAAKDYLEQCLRDENKLNE